MTKFAVICVDDEQIVLESLLNEIKEELGKDYLVELAESGEEALEILEELQEDDYQIPLVISDYVMPSMKGDMLLRKIHELDPRIMTIMLTGQSTTEGIGNAVNYAGLYRYMTKPWNQVDLILTIKEALLSYQQKEEIKKSQKALQQSEARFRSLSSSAPIGIALLDFKSNCVYTNKLWQKVTGLTAEESLGEGWFKMIHPDEREARIHEWSQTILKQENFSQEFRINASHEERWGHIRSSLMLSESDKVLEGCVVSLEDITERKHTEKLIHEKIRMEQELNTAAAIQSHLYPKVLPQLENFEFQRFFQSASETGGDWHGFMTRLEKKLFILIGDVTGHGSPAALVTAAVSAACGTVETIFMKGYEKASPAGLLKHLNQTVFETGAPQYVMTFFAACIDLETGIITFSNAGHEFPILCRRNGELKHLLDQNNPLGLHQEMEFTENSLQLEEDDLLFFFTDGLIENENPQKEVWRENMLRRYLKKHYQLPVSQLLNQLIEDIYVFYDGQPMQDDTTIVACKLMKPFPKNPAN